MAALAASTSRRAGMAAEGGPDHPGRVLGGHGPHAEGTEDDDRHP